MSRVYPRSSHRLSPKTKRTLLTAAAALIVVTVLIIGIAALVRGISPEIEYTYDPAVYIVKV